MEGRSERGNTHCVNGHGASEKWGGRNLEIGPYNFNPEREDDEYV